MIQDAHLLLTGGAGFIGTALCKRLAEGNRIRVLDNMRRNALEAAGLGDHKNIEIQIGDVRDREAVSRAMDGVDHVIHLASIAGVDTVLKNPVLTMEVSIQGTMNALQAAAEQGKVARFIDFSTSEVFGTYAYKVREADVTHLGAVGEARWTYAVSKLATEHMAHNYFKQYQLPTACIRPFNIYGPGQIGEGAVHAFVVRALRGEPLMIHNQGDQIRSWCYIDDIVEAVLRVLERPAAVGETFNIGNPRSTVTIYHLAQLVKRLAESESEIMFTSWNAADVELRIPDVAKAEDLLDFRAQVDLEEGLLRTLQWYRESKRA